MLSTISRLVAVALTAFIVSRAWDLSMLLEGGSLRAMLADQSLFSFHPACMALGMLWCFTEALLQIKARRASTTAADRVRKVQLHFFFVTAATALGSYGFWAIYQNKANSGKDHFTSNHGKAGLAAMVLMWANFLGGLARGGGAKVGFFQWLDPIHRNLGGAAFVAAAVALGLGVYSGWGLNVLAAKNEQLLPPMAAALAIGALCALAYDPKPAAAAKKSA